MANRGGKGIPTSAGPPEATDSLTSVGDYPLGFCFLFRGTQCSNLCAPDVCEATKLLGGRQVVRVNEVYVCVPVSRAGSDRIINRKHQVQQVVAILPTPASI